MRTPENTLNRSYSESNLYNVNFDIPFVRKRVLIVEEIIEATPFGFLKNTRSNSYKEILGRSTPANLDNLQSLFSESLVLNNGFNDCDISNLSLNTQTNKKTSKITNYMKNEDAVPMELDVLPNILNTDDCVNFVETMDMDIDPHNFTSGRFHNLDSVDNALKKRNTSQQSDVTCSKKSSAVQNNTKLIPFIVHEKQSHHCNFVLILVLVVLLPIFLYMFVLFIPDISSVFVNSNIQLENIQKDLLESVYKQKDSVNIIMRSLEQRENWARKIKVISFVGPAGVGKTFVANTIKKHFHQRLIHDLFGTELSYKKQWDKILTSLKNCCFNLIIIDDLKKKDTTDVFTLVQSLPHDQFILVISIFNIQNYDGKNYTINFDEIIEIHNEFHQSGLYHELVRFHSFNVEEVKNWIRKQLSQFKNVVYNLQEKILKNVLEGHDTKHQGLKGLYPKILMELEKHNQL